ncbi:dihydrofolate reductase [Acinetobacter kookii]|uniref:Dihydrofolate reductase n=1 Tax=Acinetobacter kookii TaxID=1226327 RepID=A0A1G6HL17_9GAMM|nr:MULTISPECIES: dihydrofolate reductase [Acinetobacter]TCB70376.1 dihydrofolate reductase [Acinetobacter sp. ANC 4216]SDB94932.1 dihydrofolate reductase [Acinetobacter kookii]
MSFQNLEVVHVVAMDQQRCIGKNNDLPWHISADLKHFKEITQGGVVVMGRKTLESMGRTLPKRVNWVITRDKDWSFEGTKVAYSIEDALAQAIADVKASEKPEAIFVIGGGEIFKQTMNIADRLELTHVELDVQGDAYYPEIPAEFKKVASEQHIDDKTGIAFKFATYRK